MALPKLAYDGVVVVAIAPPKGSASVTAGEEKTLPECAISLLEFGEKEEIRLGYQTLEIF